MASTTVRLFLFFLLTISFSISSDARPCKSLFVSFSVLRHRTLDSRDPFSETAVIVDITELKSSASAFGDEILHFDLPRQDSVAFQPQQQQPYLGFSYDFTSLRDRSKDILTIVVGLLFGLGSGALTAATMYLVFSLCSSRFGHGDFVDEDDFSDDDKENIKKMGYINIPDDVAPVKSVV